MGYGGGAFPMEESEIGTLVLSGHALRPKEVRQIQETVRPFSKLSRFELARTLGEHLGWRTPKGQNKVDSCLNALRKLEPLGLIERPARRGDVARPKEPVTLSERIDPPTAGEIGGRRRAGSVSLISSPARFSRSAGFIGFRKRH